ncbi:MAG: hypothetical protein ACYSU0_06040 [Planctomycetota bacterium]|jgi:hypothetical protein
MWMPLAWAFLAGCTQGALQVEAWYATVDVTEFTQEEEDEPTEDYYKVGMLSWEGRGSVNIEIAGGGRVTKKDKAVLFGGVRLRKYNGVLRLEHKETTSTHTTGETVPFLTDEEKGWYDLIEQTDVEGFFRAVGWAEGIHGTATMGLKFIDAPAYNFEDNKAIMESAFLLTFGGGLDAVIPFGKSGLSLRLGAEGSAELPIAYGGGYSVKLGYAEEKTLIQIGYRHRTWNYIFCPDSGAYPKDYRFSTEASGVFISTMLQF